MLDRRGFMRKSLGLAVGCPGQIDSRPAGQPDKIASPWEDAEYQKILAGSPSLELLGLPRDWSVVRDGFHPFSPERVVIFDKEAFPGSLWSSCYVREQVRQKLMQSKWDPTLPDELGMPERKFDILGAITDRMSSFYGRQDLADKWAFNLARREKLCSTGLGWGYGLAHQFQGDFSDRVATVNALVDWWLFLFPDGIEFGSLDERPVYAVIGHVFDRFRAGLDLRVWGLTTKLARRIVLMTSTVQGWLHDAHMDRVITARFLNRQLALLLKKERKG